MKKFVYRFGLTVSMSLLLLVGSACGRSHDQEASTVDEITTTEYTESSSCTTEAVKTYKVVLDPGHGGNDSGAYYRSEEGRINEKTVNLKIAKYLKEALQDYDNIEVIMTREKNKYVSLDERTQIASDNNADLFVSLHCNSLEGAGGYASGSTICVALGNFNAQTGLASQELGCNFVYELDKLGIRQNGLLMRSSKSYFYDNGDIADYYATIRDTMKAGIPAVIVEHAFIDNEDDFYDFLCSKKQLKKLAQADARAIARYLGVTQKSTGNVLEPLSDYQVKVCHILKKGRAKRFKKIYYKSK